MGKPASAVGDLAAHGGTIVTGSSNVLIGGRPAARVGDTVLCPFHGPGVISLGSFTVLINGMPAARLGDITGCMAPSMAPISVPTPLLGPPPVPKAATPIEGARDMARGKDGKFNEENDKSADGASVMHIEGRITDSDGNGSLDTAEAALEAVRMRNAGQVNVGGVEFGGTHSMDVLYASGKASLHEPDAASGGDGSVSGTAEAGLMKWGVGGTVGAKGSKGLNPALGVAGEVNMMHAKADGDLLVGADSNRVGIIAKGEAGAEALKGEAGAITTIPLPFGANIQATAKASGALATVGAGAGAWLYYDKKQGRLKGGIMGILKVLVGLGAEIEVSIGRPFKEEAPVPTPAAPIAALGPSPLFGGYANTPGLGAAGLPGTVLLGNPTVLIGG